MNIRSLYIAALVLFIYCSTNPVVDNGGTTEITNAKIAGYVFQIIGDAAGSFDTVIVTGAEVILRSLNTEKKVQVTDADGSFQFNSVDTGKYWLESRYDDTLGIVHALTISIDDTLIQIEEIVGEMGGIRGKLELDSSVTDPVSIYKSTDVYIPEIDIELTVDTTGIFQGNTISPFTNYTIFISNDAYPPLIDTMKVAVETGKITNVTNTNLAPFYTHDETAMTTLAQFDVEYCDTVHAVDPDGDSLYFDLLEGPIGMELTDSIISWIPTKICCKKKKVVAVTVQVRDNKGGFDIISWIIQIGCYWRREERTY